MTYTHKHNRDGFTLVEILIAIAIIAIISAVVAPNMMRWIESTRKTAAASTLKTLKISIDQFNVHTGQYPRSLKDLIKVPTYDERVAKMWKKYGPYLEKKEVPEDPWGNRYQYKLTPGQAHPYELYSYGSSEGKSTPKTDWISIWDE